MTGTLTPEKRAELIAAIRTRVKREKAVIETLKDHGELAVVQTLQTFASECGEKGLADAYGAVAKCLADDAQKQSQELQDYARKQRQ